ncbi:MAG TPA: hypothetical protein GX530_04380 [Corynebacteriales bacterium]|nr:hypothetical protein [Mycobacteriales bacterium]
MADQQDNSRTAPSEEDLRALRAADRYFDFLAAGQTPASDEDIAPELTELFTAWRGHIGATPIPPTPTLDSLLGLGDETPLPQPAVASAESAAEAADDDKVVDISKRRFGRTWKQEAMRALAGAAAFLVLAAGGLTVAIQSAGINDPLWSVNQALFTSNAQDIELATYLNQDIERARALGEAGQEEEANRVLDRVQGRLDSIGTDFRRDDVQKNLDDTRKAVNQPKEKTSTPPSTPASQSVETTSVETTEDTTEDEETAVSSATATSEPRPVENPDTNRETKEK